MNNTGNQYVPEIIVVFTDWEYFISGLSQYEIDKINRNATIKEFEKSCKKELVVETGCMNIEFNWDTLNTYGFDYEGGFTGTEFNQHNEKMYIEQVIQDALERVYDRQDFWIENEN